jgi:Exopolysaccharide biosynthesis protein YbjH/Capsule biosynthesis GfcC
MKPMKKLMLVSALGLLAQDGVQAQQQHLERAGSSPLRLSEWLQQQAQTQPSKTDIYPLGLMWNTPEERLRQQTEYAALQQLLAQQLGGHASLAGLQHALTAMPPTGRVPTHAANAAWLDANPKRDPVLKPTDTVRVPVRPLTVRVMAADGSVCDTPHKEGLQAVDYARACFADAPSAWGWLVQPDGRVQKVGLQLWNAAQQDQPAPGAWLWLPTQSGLTDAFHLRWAQWLATQGVADNVPLDAFAHYHRQVVPTLPSSSAFDVAGRGLQAQPSSSNWGNVGLMQTPTARMRDAGYFGLGFQRVWPYGQTSVFFQPMSWMETGFRYTSISNRLYSDVAAYSGDQAYKDKSIDLKLRAIQESEWLPELAVGWRDMGGTGLFSSEYVVTSKRTGRFDWSAGLAWGYLGNRANMANPLSRVLGQRFDVRQNSFGNGGTFAGSTWFHGSAAPFGGVEYQSPWNVVFKAEYDGNNYKNDPLGNSFPVKSPINLGMVYRPIRGVDLSAGIERGNTWSFGITLYADLSGLNVPKLTDPVVPAVQARRPSGEPNWQQTARDVEHLTHWQVDQIYRAQNKVVVEASQTQNPYPEVRLNKAMAVLHRDAPEDVNALEVRHTNMGSVMAVEQVDRNEWVQQQTEPARTQAKHEPVPPQHPAVLTAAVPQGAEQPLLPPRTSSHYVEPGLDFIQTLGGPDGFILYQFSAALRMGLKLPWDVQLKGLTRARLLNNYDRFKDGGSSSMPRVRTHLREYFVTSPVTLSNLSLSKTVRVSQDVYAAAYGGYFEEMFGGVGGEVLYRQPGSRWAVGVDVNEVRQRAFEQNFNFLDYKAKTGHVTGYWVTPVEGVHASLSAGQYLAGDKGATLTVSKVFANGAVMGAFATKTNVPAAVFGEGSFDKGIFWAIPFDAMLTSSSRYYANFTWKPLTRDGGAKVARPVSLFNETTWLSPLSNNYQPSPPDNDSVAPDDRLEPYQRKR